MKEIKEFENEVFEKEQEKLRRRYYYDSRNGNKLVRFMIEMTESGFEVTKIADKVDDSRLPF